MAVCYPCLPRRRRVKSAFKHRKVPMTVFEKLSLSEATKTNIQKLVDQTLEFSNALPRNVKSADPNLEASAKKSYAHTGQVRGRPLFYDFIGSGLGNGPFVELIDGSVKLDLINGIGVHIMGHSHPLVLRASISAAMADITMQGNLEPNKEYQEISEKLVEIASRNSRLKHVWLSTCGTMSNENALKACRQKRNGARKIIAMEAAFAGRSSMMAEVTDNPSFKIGLPDYNEVLRVPFYDAKDPESSKKSLEIFKSHVEKHGKDIGVFTFEPIQGEGGFNVAPKEFFVPMLEICKKEGIPVWLDEVQTFMRTGEFFCFESLGIGEYVDVCTVAKTLQNGATFFTEELNPQPGLISGTFSGSTVSLSAGVAILNELDNGKYMGANGHIASIHNKFTAMLKELNETSCKGLLNDVGGMGLMVATTPLDGSKEKVMALLKTLYNNGIIAFSCGRGPFRLRFLLPVVLTDADIAVAKTVIEKSILEHA